MLFTIPPNRWSVVALIFGVMLVLIVWILLPLWVINKFPNDYGIVGDVFGTVNSLFSALALIGVGVAVYLQYSELQDTRSALQASKASSEQETFDRRLSEILQFLRRELVEFEIVEHRGMRPVEGRMQPYRITHSGEDGFRFLKNELFRMRELNKPGLNEFDRAVFDSLQRDYRSLYEPAVELACVAVEMFNGRTWSRHHANLFVALCGREFRGFVHTLVCAEDKYGVSRGDELVSGLFASGFSRFSTEPVSPETEGASEV